MSRLLDDHGTKLMQLPPSAVVAAALADLRRRDHNNDPSLAPPYEQYAFHRLHVRMAKSCAHLIELALASPDKGADSTKRLTRILYSDLELLRAAQQAAESTGSVAA